LNIRKIKTVIKKAMDNYYTPFVWGKHGIGKSQIVKQIAEDRAEQNNIKFTTNPDLFNDKHFGFVDLRIGQMEVGDLIGIPIINEKEENSKTKWAKPDWFPTDENSKGIIFADELNRGRLDVLQAIFQLVWDRRLHLHVLPKGWKICVAANPSGSEYIVNDLDIALMDRFVHLKLVPEVKEWLEWAKNTGVKESITSFIERYPEQLGHEGANMNLDIKPSPRSWEILSNMCTDLDNDLLLEVAIGIVGNETAITYIESMKKKLESPVRANEILSNYKKHKSKVSKHANSKKPRLDLLKISCDDIERILKKDFVLENKEWKDSYEKNLVEFMRDIPKDLSFALITTLCSYTIMGSDFFNDLLLKYDDLICSLEKVAEL